MKKILTLCFLAAGLTAYAEELSFITVLSNPVGAFNKLETVDSSVPAVGSKVNFCTQIGTGGTVKLQGAKDASLGVINLAAVNTKLGRAAQGDFVLTNITLNSRGTLQGGRLLSNVVNISGSAAGKSTNNLYSNTLTVAGAKTTGLNVGNGNSVMTGTGSASEMVWSNEYQSDTLCTSAPCSKQYLLKTKRKFTLGPVDPLEPLEPIEPEYSYYWEWSNSDSPAYNMGPSMACHASCAATMTDPDVGFGPKPIAVKKAADVFRPNCTESTLGHECATGGTVKNGSVGSAVEAGTAGAPYCPIYVCKRIRLD